VTGTGKSSVFRHAIPCARLPYVLAESVPRLRVRIKATENGGRIRTIFGRRILSERGSLLRLPISEASGYRLTDSWGAGRLQSPNSRPISGCLRSRKGRSQAFFVARHLPVAAH
jgi:hypothetical protein